MGYQRPGRLQYRIAQAVCAVVARVIFRRQILRNEIRDKKGPFVVIANHQAALDFVNLIGAAKRPMSFVISNSFYSTLPIKGFLDKMGVIPKQQFQTTVKDLKRIKSVIDAGEPLVIYPAGLMCEDGLSTPIPTATYKFLKWLDADIYAARVSGTYFVMPKWGKGLRPGRTQIDIYKLFSKEELANIDMETLKQRTDEALLFDAYREQEALGCKYMNGNDIRGLEHVLYMCPHCGREFTVELRGKSTLCCSACGFEETADAYGFLKKTGGDGEELRYVSDWSRKIFGAQQDKAANGTETEISAKVRISVINEKKNKFFEVGEGTVTLTKKGFNVDAVLNGEPRNFFVSVANVPSLPFSPGRYFEIQYGQDIYRCAPEDGRIVMKLINMLKIYGSAPRVKQKQQEEAV
ncbi:MAG: 1-acyl-sn-glycerol-3-phosphate acyltransferase [Clostridia bacterium]|nr:1-acyl-sn-glycerol-3-phosphate acyltransferase [Clostridia bacterium]